MKKPILFGLILISVALLVGIILLSTKLKETQRAEFAVRDQFNSALKSVAEIQDSLNAIVPRETRLLSLTQRNETGARVTQSQKERMLSTIADLKESIHSTRERIRELEASLAGSQAVAANLQQIVAGLKRAVQEKEAAMRRLTGRVDSLSTAVTDLKADVRRHEETISEQRQEIEQKGQEIEANRQEIEEKRQEIATVHYVIGTQKMLKQQGIITERGGLLGIGKTPELAGAFTAGDFTALDTDQVSVISINGREPRVLSAQSRSSYELQVGKTQSRLQIRNASEFRKVRYLVILVK